MKILYNYGGQDPRILYFMTTGQPSYISACGEWSAHWPASLPEADASPAPSPPPSNDPNREVE